MGVQRGNLRDEVFEFVEAFLVENGYPPTYDEIREAVGLSSKSHVNYYLDILENDGLIERTPHTPRGLRLAGATPSTFEISVEGTIAAGQPIELADRPGEQIELTADLIGPRRDLYALRVRGDSMVDDLVDDGDLLIVERDEEAARGQMAVVYLCDRNEATLKRVYPEGKRVRLQPAHPTMSPFYADARDIRVQGRVVAVLRRA
ncbi:MAG: transcriptional repressor LexA [Anaerolineae bacterium]|jgi:repressor LexA